MELEGFLRRLEAARIHYSLARDREGFVMVEVSVPGERWEVEFGIEGDVEIEVFRSDGAIYGAEMLDSLFEKFGEAT